MSNDDLRTEEDDATAAESPLTAAVVTVTIERLLTQELDASCEMATEITQQILAIVECALPIPEGPPFDSDRSRIMYTGARLGAEVRQRGYRMIPRRRTSRRSRARTSSKTCSAP